MFQTPSLLTFPESYDSILKHTGDASNIKKEQTFSLIEIEDKLSIYSVELSEIEIEDIFQSRMEIEQGLAKTFDSVDEAISWLRK